MKDKTTCNRNARRTRALIEGAFLELMKDKSYTKISVREITEQADINRSTFYLHYQDVYDLLDKIETRIIEDIENTILQIRREGYVPGRHPFHVQVFRKLMCYEDVFRVLLSKKGDIDFLYRLAYTMERDMYRGWSSYYGKQIPCDLEMYASYVSFGMLGVLLRNLYLDSRWPPEQMGHLAGEVTNWLDEGIRGSEEKTGYQTQWKVEERD